MHALGADGRRGKVCCKSWCASGHTLHRGSAGYVGRWGQRTPSSRADGWRTKHESEHAIRDGCCHPRNDCLKGVAVILVCFVLQRRSAHACTLTMCSHLVAAVGAVRAARAGLDVASTVTAGCGPQRRCVLMRCVKGIAALEASTLIRKAVEGWSKPTGVGKQLAAVQRAKPCG